MIEGHVDEAGHPLIEIKVALGLELDSSLKVELADGSVKPELVFSGRVFWRDQWHDVDILITMGEEALVGTGLMEGQVVHLDFRENRVSIE